MIIPLHFRPSPARTFFRSGVLVVLGLFGILSPVRSDPLSASDRQLLLERLAELKDAAEGQNSTRVSTAINAFRTAMANKDGVIALYLKCIEKLNFEDQNRSGQDFRIWKRRQSEQLKDPAFQLALRYQLHWLTLTLEASLSHGDFAKMSPKASAALQSLFTHPDEIAGQQSLLRHSALSSVFARAYKVSYVDPGDWPTEPLAIAEIYKVVILPPLGNPKSLDSLREAWLTRIQQEGLLCQLDAQGGGTERGRAKSRGNARSPSYEKFLVDERPDLLWQMEVDLFRAGDQQKAALRMLKHLERYQNHPKATDWAQQFIDLITPPKPEPESNGGEAGSRSAPPD